MCVLTSILKFMLVLLSAGKTFQQHRVQFCLNTTVFVSRHPSKHELMMSMQQQRSSVPFIYFSDSYLSPLDQTIKVPNFLQHGLKIDCVLFFELGPFLWWQRVQFTDPLQPSDRRPITEFKCNGGSIHFFSTWEV